MSLISSHARADPFTLGGSAGALMILKTVFVRFYKSFNYDYLRKHLPKAEPRPWELIDGMWYPYVRVPIDPKVTTIVGANESGKSHLLSAVEKGISGQQIEREDFCRYSHFFTVETGKRKWPDFGFEWGNLSEEDRTAVREALGTDKEEKFERFYTFRKDKETFDIYIGDSKDATPLSTDKTLKLVESLPRVFHIDAKVALPDSVPISFLRGTAPAHPVEAFSRERRFELMDAMAGIQQGWVSTPQHVTQSANQLSSTLSKLFASAAEAQLIEQKSLRLAKDLLLKVTKIDPDVFGDLERALRKGHEGHANGIIDSVNEALAKHLNFPHWWAQDKQFALRVSPREFDLVFTIRDRTGTDYSFAERSQGLKYFLSYYVQYQSHDFIDGDEILLMDEPDAYLSSQAQQDLVKVFEAFASENDGHRPVQVIYVTHSPFLIDKNHAERIRVLEKGVEDEGTRVVKDAAKNHYEPLRSAFGAFVAETAFIGTCNLFVEGIADQVLLAGASNYLRTRGRSSLQLLDLNQLTIVPARSASHIPYLVFLATGRDVERPAIVALLDSDQAGDTARRDLERDSLKRKRLLKPEFILQVGDLFKGSSVVRTSTHKEIEIEDLVPPELCADVVGAFLAEMGVEDLAQKISKEELRKRILAGQRTWDCVEQQVSEVSNGEIHIEKVGFARALTAILSQVPSASTSEELKTFESNMTTLFERLGEKQRAAMRERSSVNVMQRIERARKAFIRDHPKNAKAEDALVLLEDMENALDDTREGDATRYRVQQLRREFHLDSQLTSQIEDYPKFLEALERVKYTARLSSQEDQAVESAST